MTGQNNVIKIIFLVLSIYTFIPLLNSQESDEVEQSAGLPETIKIGGLFDEGGPDYEAAFKHAVERVNSDTSILPRSTLSAEIEQLEFGDSHHAAEKACDMMGSGIAALFGPQSPEAASHVQSICDAFELPHIETKWDHQIRKENYLINLAPHPDTLSRAYNDLVEGMQWTSYVVIYENTDSLYLIQDLLKANNPPDRAATLKQLPEGDDYKPLLKEILHADTVHNIIIDCVPEKLAVFFKQAQQLGVLTYKYSIMVMTLDLHTLDLDDYRFGDMNITGFRVVDPERPDVLEIMKEWSSLIGTGGPSPTDDSDFGRFINRARRGSKKKTTIEKYMMSDDPDAYDEQEQVEPEVLIRMMPTDTALLYDAVMLFAKALHILDSSQLVEITPLGCDSKETWQHGYSVINYMKMFSYYGMTGMVHFNPAGYRTDLQMDVIQLKEGGLEKVGNWDSKFIMTKINWTIVNAPVKEEPAEDYSTLRGKKLVVTSIMNAPFMMLKRSEVALSGNDQFEGFTVDLLDHLGSFLGFDYEIRIVADGSYGSLNKKTGEWNGMIREVIDGVADIAVADLTINKDRQKALEFSMPFMNLGISILFVEPKKKAPELFSFMNPFEQDVWIYTFTAIFAVTTIMFLCGRLSPFEWQCPHPCIDDPDELENQFTFLNSLWFTSGALLGGGSDVAPIATSTRIIAASWWFFTLIMVSSYTANLASFLLVQMLDEPIKTLEDLGNQNVIKYGCVGSGSTAAFFKFSPFPARRAMWMNMEQWNKETPGILPKNNVEGVAKVVGEAGKYAFFMESTVIEYQVERVCGITQVGGLLDSKGYGVGTKIGTYRNHFNGGILKLQEGGVIDKLKRKWWMEERKGAGCGDDEADSGALNISHVAGCFVVLTGGCFLAIILVFIELWIEGVKTAAERGKSVISEMRKDLRIAFTSLRTTKPVNEDFGGEFEDKEESPPKEKEENDDDKDSQSSDKS